LFIAAYIAVKKGSEIGVKSLYIMNAFPFVQDIPQTNRFALDVKLSNASTEKSLNYSRWATPSFEC